MAELAYTPWMVAWFEPRLSESSMDGIVVLMVKFRKTNLL
jgi:hypothetical protein